MLYRIFYLLFFSNHLGMSGNMIPGGKGGNHRLSKHICNDELCHFSIFPATFLSLAPLSCDGLKYHPTEIPAVESLHTAAAKEFGLPVQVHRHR